MSNETSNAARQRAQELFDNRRSPDAKALDEGAIAQRAEAAKTARLRELRLAKEAADRTAAGRHPAARRQHHGKPLPTEPSRRKNDLSGQVETLG